MDHKKAPFWIRMVAGILDFLTVFLVGGYALALIAGQVTGSGFTLSGRPALILIVLILAYFFILNGFLGGTIWQRLLGTRK